jgi:lysophospholipase L1-like esterase
VSPTLAVGLLALSVGLAPVAAADAVRAKDAPRAVAAWSMVAQSKDANADGFIDGDGGVPKSGALSSRPSTTFVGSGNRVAQPNERLIGGQLSWYLSPRGYPVRLDACSSRGDRYRWRVIAAGSTVRTTDWRDLGSRKCRRTVVLPEGDYTFALDVRTGSRRDSTSIAATVQNILIVAMGDSYASGEGNPRNVRSWLRRGGAFSPYWDDDPCRRSTRAAPAQAALALERASRTTSVTLIFVACSGATIDRGVLGAQVGAGQSESQVEQATRLLGGRQADLVLISVGGNDVGFTSVLETCARNVDCPTARASSGPLSSYPTLQAGIQAQTAELPGDFDRVSACIGGSDCQLADGRSIPGLALAEAGRVLPVLYPDITRAADGSSCSYLTIGQKDFAWARDTVLVPNPVNPYPYPLARGGTTNLAMAAGSLNQQIASTARIDRWNPVTGAWYASGDSAVGHGVCAGDAAWVFAFTGFTALPSASFHPNPPGQAVLGRAIAQAAKAALAS